jgi:cytochrome c peroxidase
MRESHRKGVANRKAERLVDSENAGAIDDAAIQSEMSVLGRCLVTKKEADVASFKTPNLRNVLITAPYFHDGSQATLWGIVDHYNKGDSINNPFLDENIQPLALSEKDIDDLVAFMASLTSVHYREQGLKELARQQAMSLTNRPQRDTAHGLRAKTASAQAPRSHEHSRRNKVRGAHRLGAFFTH